MPGAALCVPPEPSLPASNSPPLAGDLDPITWQPFTTDLQPATAPLPEAETARGSGGTRLAARPSGLRHKSGKGGTRPPALGSGNGGNTLTNYMGFLRGLSKPAPTDFKPPRAGSSQQNTGSQDDSGMAASGGSGRQQPEADTSSSGQAQQQSQQEQQQQQQRRLQSQAQQRSATASPKPLAPAAEGAADMLASPTEEQWQSFRREAARRQRDQSSRRAAPAAAGPCSGAAKPRVPPASRSACAAPPVVRRPAGAAPGSLMARLKAALGPQLAPADFLAGCVSGGMEGRWGCRGQGGNMHGKAALDLA
jgi:hypothetical protein